MRIRQNNWISIGPEVFLLGSLFLLLMPLSWIVAWIVAALVHELGHILAIRLCDGEILGIQIRFGGAAIQAGGLSYGKEFLCSIAGPICGLLLLLGIHRFPRLAICALLQSVYNLLPVFPLDGGRALRSLLCQFLPADSGVRASRVISYGTILLLALAGTVALRLGLGLFPLLLPLVLFLRSHGQPE